MDRDDKLMCFKILPFNLHFSILICLDSTAASPFAFSVDHTSRVNVKGENVPFCVRVTSTF